MTLMTPAWERELKEGPKRRLKKVKAVLGIEPNQGYRVRYTGTYMMPDQKIYYVYRICHRFDHLYKTGLNRYALLSLDDEEYRAPYDSDEILMLMLGKAARVYID